MTATIGTPHPKQNEVWHELRCSGCADGISVTSQSYSKVKTSHCRLSNIELLRIISMLMVLAVHIDGASLGLPDLTGNISALSPRSIWQLGVESLTIVGVNCFTLISGYFGIRLRVKSVVSYLFQCIFYAVGIYILFATPSQTSLSGLLESFMVLTHTDLWYVPAYFGLMLLSPFLNAATESLGRKRFGTILAAFILFNLWAGWLWGGKFNPTGYTLIQLIMVYMTGRYIKLHTPDNPGCRASLKSFTLYLAMAACVFITAIYMQPKAFAYNSPFVLAESIALFLTFRYMNINSKLINQIAKSAFAVYLIHKDPHIFAGIMKPTIIDVWNHTSLLQFTVYGLALMAVIYSIAMIVDSVRIFLDVKICKLLRV